MIRIVKTEHLIASIAVVANIILLGTIGVAIHALLLGLDFLVDCLHGNGKFLDIADSKYAITTALNISIPIGTVAFVAGLIIYPRLTSVGSKIVTVVNSYVFFIAAIILLIYGKWFVAKLLDGESLRSAVWWL